MPVSSLDLHSTSEELPGELDVAWHRLFTPNDFVPGVAVAGFESVWPAYCGVEDAEFRLQIDEAVDQERSM